MIWAILAGIGYPACGMASARAMLPQWWREVRKQWPDYETIQRDEIVFRTLMTMSLWPLLLVVYLTTLGMNKLIASGDPDRSAHERERLDRAIAELEQADAHYRDQYQEDDDDDT